MARTIKFARTLYIGLGGAGLASLLHTKKRYIDTYGEVPPMVAFLAIDTDKAIRDKSVASSSGKDVKFNENELCTFSIYGDAKKIYQANTDRFDWLPERNEKFIPSGLRCASQVRTNARFILSCNAPYVESFIEKS